jgi:hypothetical protein
LRSGRIVALSRSAPIRLTANAIIVAIKMLAIAGIAAPHGSGPGCPRCIAIDEGAIPGSPGSPGKGLGHCRTRTMAMPPAIAPVIVASICSKSARMKQQGGDGE